MLFSGGTSGTKGTPPKEQRKERKPDRDEKYEIQETVFLRWANSIVDDSDNVLLQEMKEMADIRFLSKFSQLILGVPVAMSGKNDADDIDAIFHAMVPDDPDDKLFQISVNELLSGQQKPLLTMCWQLIQIYWAKFAPPPSNQRKMTEALKEWCLQATAGHKDVVINDFTSSFRDGMAINILIKSFDDTLVDLQEISELRGEDRIENALSMARRLFKVPRVIMPKEFASEHLDMKSVACYLMMLYLGMCESSSRPAIPSTATSSSAITSKEKERHESPASNRRRSTAPANVNVTSSTLPHQSSSITSSTSEAQPQQQRQAQPAQVAHLPQLSPTSPVARASLGQAMLQIPVILEQSSATGQTTAVVATAYTPPRIIAPEQPMPQPQHPQPSSSTTATVALSPTSRSSLPSTPPATQSVQTAAAAPPIIVQANMLSPPPIPQSPKAYVSLFHHHQGAKAPVISPLAQQSHTSAQLLQQQQPQPQQQPVFQLQAPPQQPQQTQIVQSHQIVQHPSVQQFVPIPTQIHTEQLHAHNQQQQQQIPVIQQPLQPAQQQQKQHSAAAGSIIPYDQHQLPPLPSLPTPQQPTTTTTTIPKLPTTTATEYPPQLSPKSPKSIGQFTLPAHSGDGSVEGTRSRKSSSSSHTSKRRDIVQEYGNCLQQVLAWLNEAEHELVAMGEVPPSTDGQHSRANSLEFAKDKFREHEQYMQSLTQSQESVGRVLHRGHQLSQRMEGEQATAVQAQLQLVSERWEHIREKAMQRQTALQNQIDRIQREHLGELIAWLDKMESNVGKMDTLADNVGQCQRQQHELGELRHQMEGKRPAIKCLSTFVAVVEQSAPLAFDGAEGGGTTKSNLTQLETAVKQVDKRWANLSELLEQRGKLLDGLTDLLEQYDQSWTHLSSWLTMRVNELQQLRTARELASGEQVQEQLDLLRAMEKALETQQEAFVRLSQICTELAGKYERGNNLTAYERVHERLDSVTRTWDEIVRRLEEHSEMLIHSGKVKLATDIRAAELGVTPDHSTADDSGASSSHLLREPRRMLETIYSVEEPRSPAPPPSPSKKRKIPPETSISTSEQQLGDSNNADEEEQPQPPAAKKELRFAEAVEVKQPSSSTMTNTSGEEGAAGTGGVGVSAEETMEVQPSIVDNQMETDEEGAGGGGGGNQPTALEEKQLGKGRSAAAAATAIPVDVTLDRTHGVQHVLSSSGEHESEEMSPPFSPEPTSDGTASTVTREPQQMVNQFVQKVSTLDQRIHPLVEWAQSGEVQSASSSSSATATALLGTNVRQLVLMCQKKLNDVRDLEPAVTKLQIQLEYLHNRTSLTKKQLHLANEVFDMFMSRWSRVVSTISKLLNNLSKPEPIGGKSGKSAERLTQQKQQQQKAAMENRVALIVEQLTKWVNASHKYMDELPTEMPMNEKLKKIAQIAKQLNEQQAQISHVKRVAKLAVEEEQALTGLEHEMVMLLRRIDKVRRQADQPESSRPRRHSPCTTTVQFRRSDSASLEEIMFPSPSQETASFACISPTQLSPPPLNEAESLRLKLLAEEEELTRAKEQQKSAPSDSSEVWTKWLEDKQHYLRLGDACVPGDLKLLSAELERCDIVIEELRNKQREASSSESEADMRMVGPIEQLIKAAETKRNHCVDNINKTQLAIHKAVKVEEVGDKFKRELDWLRAHLAESPLKEADEQLKHLKQSLHAQQGTKLEAIQLLEEIARMASIGAAEQMRNRIAKLELQWRNLEEDIEALLACCTNECHKRAECWLQSKQTLLEELEHALKASFESATDAEELSEHLDNLERVMDRLAVIEREAQEEGYQQELTAYHPQVIALREQHDGLARTAQERCNQLRNAIARCEHFEQRLCQMQQSCTNMHQILNQRIASDTATLEVPNEYKEAQRTGTLFKRMDAEFAEFDKLVAELADYISQSRSEFASTERLKLQLDHANQQLSQLRAKFADFKQPIGLLERMDRIEKQLAEIESSIDDLTGIQAENCQFCLLHIEQLQRHLEELGTECAACEAARDTLIREGILEEAQAVKMSARLAELTHKCVEELEPRAKANVQRLKRAKQELDNLERENAVLDKLIGEVEHRLEGELDQTLMDGKPTQKSVKALDELSRQLRAATDAAAKAREMDSILRQLSVKLAPETLESIAKAEHRCKKLKERLAEWDEKIQELAEFSQTGDSSCAETTDEEKALAKMEVFGKELDKRISQLEAQITANECGATHLAEQLVELRPLKERFDKRALQMLGKSDFSRKIAATLADLTSRWQTLVDLQKTGKMEMMERQRGKAAATEQQQTIPGGEMPATAMQQQSTITTLKQQQQQISASQLSPATMASSIVPIAATVDSSLLEPIGARVVPEPFEGMSDFGHQVQAMISDFEQASTHLNYAKMRLRSVTDWEQRLTQLEQYVADRKLHFDELVTEGKRVADVGPMELVTSAALAKLDQLINLVRELDEQIDREQERLHKWRRQYGKFNGQLQMTHERMEDIEQRAGQICCEGRPGTDTTPVITLQQELMDTSGQLQLLQLSADELRKSLPSTLHEERIGGDVLDQLNRRLHEIEARVQTALMRALQTQQQQQQEEQGMNAEEEEERGIQKKQQFAERRMPPTKDNRREGAVFTDSATAEQPQPPLPGAMGTTAPLLAMDAYGTDEEATVHAVRGGQRDDAGGGGLQQRIGQQQKQQQRWEAKPTTNKAKAAGAGPEELLQSSVTTHLSTQPKTTTKTAKKRASIEELLQPHVDELISMDQFYVNLNTMEEYMEQPESLPFEGLDEKADILKDFEAELKRGEQLFAARQMTMEVGESEHILGRIAGLRQQMAQARRGMEQRRATLRGLENLYAECEQMLLELAQQCKLLRHSPKHIKSMNGGGAGGQADVAAESPPPPSAHRNGSPDLDELETIQATLERQLAPIAVRMQQIQNRLNEIVGQLSANESDKYQQRICLLVEDFNECTKVVRAKRKVLEERFADQTHLDQHIEDLEFWCDETEAILDSDGHLGALNLPKLEQHIERVRQRHCSADAKHDAFVKVERLKDRFIGLASVEPQAKHEVRRNVAQLGKRISDLRMRLKEKVDVLLEEKMSAEELWREFYAMQQWVENAERQIHAVENAKIYKPSLVNIEALCKQIDENRGALHGIQRRLANENAHYQQQQQADGITGGGEGGGAKIPMEKENLMRVDDLLKAFEKVAFDINRLLEQRAAASEESSSVEEEFENLYNQMDITKQKLAKNIDQQAQQQQQPMKPRENGWHYEKQATALVPRENDVEYGTLSSTRDSLDNQQGGEHHGGGGGLIGRHYDDEDEEETAAAVMGMALGRQPRRKMSVGEQARLDTVTRLRSWLQEVERDVSLSVDLSDQHLVRQALGKMQNCLEEIQVHQLEIIRVLSEAKDRLIVERAQICSAEMDRVLGVCRKRKGELQKILEQCRIWEQLRSAIEHWLNEANDRLMSGGRIVELPDPELEEQVEMCNQLASELDVWKEKLSEMNRVSNQLLDVYRRDDGHNLSHLSSKLNTQWTKFNDQLRIRRAVIEATQRSRHDFQTALGHLQQWMNKQSMELQRLEKDTDNLQRVKDTGRRREWLAQEKEARMEIDAHREMMELVKRMGRKLLEEQQQEMSSGEETGSAAAGTAGSKLREQMRRRVEAMESEWQAMLELAKIVRHRLESAQEECERLTQSLAEFLFWTDQQRKTIGNSKPIGGDLSAVQKQCDIARTIQRGIEARERPVEECIQLAHEFLMQHNLRPPLHTPHMLADPSLADPYSPKTEAEREERHIGQQINSDSKQLQTEWAILKEELASWYQQVSDAYKEMQDLDRAMAEALLTIGTVEEGLQALKPVEDLMLEELKSAKAESGDYRQRVHEAGMHVDDVNNWASSIQATGIQLSEQLERQVHDVNERYERLKRDLGCRWAALERAFNDFGPGSEHFLINLVEPPWQRAVSSTNRLPYYIDHSTERTQWDHPAMVDILEGLCAFNQVKFSAYRTAMKLRALQKRLCLDLIDLADLNVQYEKELSNYMDDQRIQVEDVIQCLLPLFEKAHEERPALVSNVSLAVDLTLNLLLNIYDPCRDGKMRALSFKIALVVLCHATLESKYTYLFHLISNKNGVDHKRLAVLFYDLIYIPKFLGEAAAFGGSNIEPSVRSCFEHAKFPPTIHVDQFLVWLKKEPQSLVWLPVMHRLASSEFAKHQAKCNACKMFPIVGLRYRCLRCFNFDICQNCFFSQRIAKSHKLNHPMQEYCTPTSTGDDVRDFTAIIKNKVRQSKGGKIGYLPVEQINEGPPLECTDQTPQNASTEAMHQRMHLISSRLDKRQTEAAEQFPNAVTEGKINGNLALPAGGGGGKSVTINNGGGVPAPIMFQNDNDSEQENGSNGDVDEQQQQQEENMKRMNGGGGGHLQSPEMQIYHDTRQRAAANTAAMVEVKSPSQLVTQVDQASKEELGQLLQKLQYENLELKRAIEERKKALRAGIPYQNGAKSTPNLYNRTPVIGYNGTATVTGTTAEGGGGQQQQQMRASEMALNSQHAAPPAGPLPHSIPDAHQSRATSVGQTTVPTIFSRQPTQLPPPVPRHYPHAGRQMPGPLHRQLSLGSPINSGAGTLGYAAAGAAAATGSMFDGVNDHEQQMAVLAEAHQLRMHQKRLEERGVVLEDQNRQLQMQLDRLQKLMEKRGETPGSTPLTGQLPLARTDIQPGAISSTEAEDTDMEMLGVRGSDIRAAANTGLSTGQIGTEIRRNRMDRLRETVDELNRAMENFVLFTQNCAANQAAVARRDDTDDQDSGTAEQTTDEQDQ